MKSRQRGRKALSDCFSDKAGASVIIGVIGRLLSDPPVIYLLILFGTMIGALIDIFISAPVYGKNKLLNVVLFIGIYCVAFLIILGIISAVS